MFASLAVQEPFIVDENLASQTQEIKMNQVKNILASRTQIFLPTQMFPSLVILEETIFL